MRLVDWTARQSRTMQARHDGDRARDLGDWPKAEDAYSRFLASRPSDFGIRVQFGHSLKEQGKFEEAATEYQKALVLRPGDRDANTHLAHLLKRIARDDEAADVFMTLLRAFGAPGRLSGTPSSSA